MTTKSLKIKLIIILILSIALPLSLVLVIDTIKYQSFAKKVAINDAKIEMKNISNKITNKLEGSFISLTAFEGIYKSAFQNKQFNLDIDKVIELNKEYLKNNPVISSTHLLLEPNTFVDKITGEFNKNYVLISVERKNNKIVPKINDNYKLKYGLYQKLKQKTKHDSIVEPYFNTINGENDLVISYIRQIYKDNNILGAAWFNISINWIQSYLENNIPISNDENIILCSHFNMIIGNIGTQKEVGKNIEEVENLSYLIDKINNKKDISEYQGLINIIDSIKFAGNGNNWKIIYTIQKNKLFFDIYKSLTVRIIIGTLFILFITILGYTLLRKIITRVTKLSKITKEFAQGNLNVEFKDKDRENGDEITELAYSLENTKIKFREVLKDIAKTSKELYDSSSKIEKTASKLSEGASEQASSTEEVSASMEQMTAIIEQNAENAKIADAIAKKSAQGIAANSENVIRTTKSMGEIADKTSIIGDIAFQTNILALNAAVEAARAGVHGKGFGVVAAEVGKLAENAKKAANEISDLTNKSFTIAKKSGELLQQIEPDIKKTAQLVQEISDASIEQKAGTEQINNAIQQLNNVTQENAGSAELLATNVEVLNALADKLGKLTSFFKLEKTEELNLKPEKEVNTSQSIIELQEDEEIEELDKKIIIETEPKKEINKENTQNDEFLSSKGFKLDLDDENDDEFEKF